VTIPASVHREWQQFRLLSRDAVRQLIDTALFARDADPMEFALWMLALVATPPAFFASRQIFVYTVLINAPPEVVERVALAHWLFFVTYGMLAAALLAALTWEALFPDGRDQEILGVLPIRPRTVAASRLRAALTVAVVFAGAVNVPSAVIYSTFAAGHALMPNVVTLLTGHVLATMLGSLLVFLASLIARGLAAVALGARAAAWLGAALQVITVILLFEVFLFLPGVLGTFVKAMLRGDTSALWFPPVWFASLHAWLAGSSRVVISESARTGLMAFAVAAIAVLPMYLLPARWLARRALETRPRERTIGLTSLVKAVATLIRARSPVRSVYAFSVASLFRSRSHLFVLATYFGLAIAVCLASFVIADVRGTIVVDAPSPLVLALPLVFMFFLVIGLRASFRIPTDLDANWAFRISQPSLGTCISAATLVMFVIAVAPVAGISVAATIALWPARDVATIAILQLLAGLVLIQCALFGWTKVPFASAHAPSPEVLKAKWPIYVVALYLYAFKLANWQFVALRSTRALAAYMAAAVITILVIQWLRARKLRRATLQFDVIDSYAIDRLNLSEAVN